MQRASRLDRARRSASRSKTASRRDGCAALVATSSLELGIDMGAIDLVDPDRGAAVGRQRHAAHRPRRPPGRRGQRRASSSRSTAAICVACAAVTRAMHEGAIEPTRYPRNPLDVLAQQIVAMVVDGRLERRRAVRARPPRGAVRGAGRGVVRRRARHARRAATRRTSSPSCGRASPGTASRTRSRRATGAKRVAITNGGTIPDRGLYGVFLAGARQGASARVGELDEEMVFERASARRSSSARRRGASRRSRTIACSSRPRRASRARCRSGTATRPSATARVRRGDRRARARAARHAAAPRRVKRAARASTTSIARAAENLLQYLDDQAAATGAVPDDRTIVIERVPRRARRLARLRPDAVRRPHPRAVGDGGHGEGRATSWRSTSRRCGATTASSSASRRPTQPPRAELVLPEPDEVEALVRAAARLERRCSRRSSARPRRARCCCRGDARERRTPLWQQRKTRVRPAAGRVALRLVPDDPGDVSRVPARRVRPPGARRDAEADSRARRFASSTADTQKPSPFAASLLFRYVANFIYDGDAPLAERRAQALAIDQAQLRELLGEPELRELLDPDCARASVERELQHLDERHKAKSPTRSTICCCASAICRASEIAARSIVDAPPAIARARRRRARDRRAVAIARRERASSPSRTPAAIATRSACRCRRACRSAISSRVADPVGDLVLRYARTHGPFTPDERRGALRPRRRGRRRRRSRRFVERGRLIEGEFRPGGTQREWCDSEVLRSDPPHARWRSCARRSSRSSRRRSRASSPRGRASRRSAAGSTRCSRSIETLQGVSDGGVDPRERDPRRAHRRLQAVRPRHAQRRPARSSGSASSRSASATAGSRSTSPITLAAASHVAGDARR